MVNGQQSSKATGGFEAHLEGDNASGAGRDAEGLPANGRRESTGGQHCESLGGNWMSLAAARVTERLNGRTDVIELSRFEILRWRIGLEGRLQRNRKTDGISKAEPIRLNCDEFRDVSHMWRIPFLVPDSFRLCSAQKRESARLRLALR